MQLIHVAGFINRVIYNGCKAYADQLKAGESYKLTDVVAISICDFELWPDAEQDAQKLPRVPMLSRWYMTESISDNHRFPENQAGTNRLLQVQYAQARYRGVAVGLVVRARARAHRGAGRPAAGAAPGGTGARQRGDIHTDRDRRVSQGHG